MPTYAIGLGRPLRLAAVLAIAVLLVSPPASAPAGVVLPPAVLAPVVTLCPEVEGLVGPWTTDEYFVPYRAGELPPGTTPLLAGPRVTEPASRSLLEEAALVMLGLATDARDLAGVGLVELEYWTECMTAMPTLGGEATAESPAPVLRPDLLGAAAMTVAFPSAVSDPGAPEADAWIQPRLGPLHWIPTPPSTGPASPVVEPDPEPSVFVQPVLASFNEIVLPLEGHGLNVSLGLVQQPTETILKMGALGFIATIVLIPLVCSATAGAMYAR